MKNKTLILGLFGVYLFVFLGCASIMSTDKQTISIRSNPTQANITIDEKIVGHTPLFIALPRKNRHVISVLNGKQSLTRVTTRSFNWWYLGNLFSWGPIGLIIDPLTGAWFNIDPANSFADFENPEKSI